MRLSSLILGLLGLGTTLAHATLKHPPTHITYTVVPGIFQQDSLTTDPITFNFTAQNFGLINRTYPTDSTCPNRKHSTQWQRLAHYITSLNSKRSKANSRHVLLFLARHGEGYHNAAESYYGTPAWNCYYSLLDGGPLPSLGNGTYTWADAHLTPTGISQAQAVNRFWKHLIEEEKIAPPERYYTSPLYRCLETARYSFEGLPLGKKNAFMPIIKEGLREGISLHTCDRRSEKSYIHANFPYYRFEKGFPEHDPYWTKGKSETREAQDARSKAVLDDVFTHDLSTYISVTAHSGEIASLLRVLGHRVFSLSTGAAIPVLVKVTTVRGEDPTPTQPAMTSVSTCATAPTIRASSCNDCSCCT